MEEKEKNRVTVVIMGEEYSLRGSSPPEYMQRVGLYVDNLMRNLAESNIQMSKHRIAVLAALNLADELMKLKQARSEESNAGPNRSERNELA